MWRYDTTDLRALRRRLAVHFTFIPFFLALHIAPAQEAYFLRRGVDGGKALGQSTIRARLKRWGYYRRPPRRGASSRKPYGVWSGNTLDHTSEKKGRKTVRVGVMTIQHNLKRRIVLYWDEKNLERYVERAAEDYFQRVLDGRRLPRRIAPRRAA